MTNGTATREELIAFIHQNPVSITDDLLVRTQSGALVLEPVGVVVGGEWNPAPIGRFLDICAGMLTDADLLRIDSDVAEWIWAAR